MPHMLIAGATGAGAATGGGGAATGAGGAGFGLAAQAARATASRTTVKRMVDPLGCGGRLACEIQVFGSMPK